MKVIGRQKEKDLLEKIINISLESEEDSPYPKKLHYICIYMVGKANRSLRKKPFAEKRVRWSCA